MAAVRFGDACAISCQNGNIEDALDRLEAHLGETQHLIGHNILRHDLPHLAALRPRLGRLAQEPIDTLWLNPLAFPRNPYHHLVKHYHDGRLMSGHVNDPEADARLVFVVLGNQLDAFRALNTEAPDAVTAYHYLTTRGERDLGFSAVFRHVRRQEVPSSEQARQVISRLLEGQACAQAVEEVLREVGSPFMGWPLAYALSWISVAGGDSVMPPWVRMQFPDAARMVKRLRDTSCDGPDCAWCREKSDPVKALFRWFGFDAFRPTPTDAEGRPLQERIVDEGMRGKSLLGILPTGTGKSVCYQIPALAKFDRTGALTVVISPLVALMADQVAGMERSGISSAVTVNGMLSLPERQDALDKVRMGEAAMLLISPEQLRSVAVRSVLGQREIGLWVLDEAHCVSKWGHDFRPDYRYIPRFIKETSGDMDPAPVICLTATAKPEVVSDIHDHFLQRLGTELLLLDGGASRTNLSFEVRSTGRRTKLADILEVIEKRLPPEGASGAVVYCATRKATEDVAQFLQQQGLAAERYHAGLTPDEKKTIQESFRIGDLRVIAATNAFGMGIDKPDIRLVVHGDIPGSLENYLQEAGRAGRDRNHANCVLLFAPDDVERQFQLSARSRLARHEIGAILKAVRRMDTRTRSTGTVVATSGEIVRSEQDREFQRESATDDTRVKTALSWLEEAKLLTREENRVQVFPSSLRVRGVDEAGARLEKAQITGIRRTQLLDIVRHLMNAPVDEGISTDELSGVSGLTGGQLTKALADLETLGIARNDTAVTVFVHHQVADDSRKRLVQASRLETDLIALMREEAPDADNQASVPFNLQLACQKLRDTGHSHVRPDVVEKLLRGMARDGRDLDGGKGNVRLRKTSRSTLFVALQRSWSVLEKSAELRRQAGEALIEHLLGKLEKGQRGKDLQVETTLGDMLACLSGDAFLRGQVKEMTRLMDRALLWLHEQEVVALGKGMTVFRPAMTVQLAPGKGQFLVKDFTPLQEHYDEQTVQTHVMAAYAETGLTSMRDAQRLSEDYFALDQEAFMGRWMKGKTTEVKRQTTGKSWQAVVEALDNPVQQKIVADDRDATNVLVLAGPGSGKTRVLVHRIAYLIRVRREDPRSILVLSYNRHAAVEIRARLRHIIGDEAFGVTVSTCHALAMRLVGVSFAGSQVENRDFDGIVMEAARQLNGEGLSKTEAEAQRETLIQGYRWILVDEYQDIGPEEYALIAAVAGRAIEDEDLKLSLFAVGDDDQNIYAFAGASIRYIRQFEQDYRAKPEFLVENYRSTRHIIEASNTVIAGAADRMKLGKDITVDRKRRKALAGGAMAERDPVGQGRVQLLQCPPGDRSQAVAAVSELQRLAALETGWNWSRTAVIARNWRQLAPVRAYAEAQGIPVEMANESLPSLWRLREMRQFIEGISRDRTRLLNVTDLLEVSNSLPRNRWTDLIAVGIAALVQEIGSGSVSVPDLVEWFGEWSRDARSEQRGLMLMTAHRAKGLEFDDVVILDGGWNRPSKGEDFDAPRRLFYVAMTRARRSLAVMTQGTHAFVPAGGDNIIRRHAALPEAQDFPPDRTYLMPDMGQVFIDWAGRLRNGDASLSAIAQAQVGDPVTLVQEFDRWWIRDAKGRTLVGMKGGWGVPAGQRIVSAEVGAIVGRHAHESGEDHRHKLHRDSWDVVLPEVVLE
ncbi:RecQ family ATP-dependent DNA helicase [Leisingera caerulea]|uniref:DNA 3'-5' helicase n=1 Tax=Leisingera caerulea TaxID=506591 RepID=A0ABY5X1X4_LEICA|nr:RecQ family ATP-dependent DNA helicase [Leisingera caerulea]UWQ60525.1 RecQ family ATP-dependent DNA helicase [Leisingera caerulea]